MSATLDVSAAVEMFAADYTVTRTPVRGYTAGVLDAAAPTTFGIRAAIFPGQRKQAREDEGDYSIKIVRAWQIPDASGKLLQTADGAYEADRLVFQGDVYQVDLVKFWEGVGGYRYAEAVLA